MECNHAFAYFYKNYNLTVGLRIREIREAHNMTRAEFSEKCNISDSFLAAVENKAVLNLI